MSSQTFSYTGGWQVFTVPANVTKLTVDCKGAGNGAQAGGRITGTLTVAPGQKLYLVVGGEGKANSGSSAGGGGWGGGGGGGNGRSANGGTGGGGYSAIRLGGTTGKILCVAGGAGGRSGDGGSGGSGGGVLGGTGGKGSAGSGTAVKSATGGSQTGPGTFGQYTGGSQPTQGTSGSSSILGGGGRGGNPGAFDGPGGGGGGGGYFGGGGGGGGSTGWGGGGGGGGGSNYAGSLTGVGTTQGSGDFTNGAIILTWSAGALPGHPNVPSITAPTEDQRTRTTNVLLKADVGAHYSTNLKLVVNIFAQSSDGSYRFIRQQVSTGSVAVTQTGGNKPIQMELVLPSSTRYQVNVWAHDSHGVLSTSYAVQHFYTNYPPDAPTLLSPADNATIGYTSPISFTWSHNDPDGEATNDSEIRFQAVGGVNWETFKVTDLTSSFISPAQHFAANTFWQWQVRTADPEGLWGPWSDLRSFYINGAPTPPLPISPVNSTGVDVTDGVTFTWRFRDPILSNTQAKADLRYRRSGDLDDTDWIQIEGNTTTPGSAWSWTLPPNTIVPGFTYEWQARTYDALGGGLLPSGWSASALFIAIERPGRDAGVLMPATADFSGTLGCGDNSAYVFMQGGSKLVGKLSGISSLQYARTRDDISVATVTIQTQGNPDVCQLIAQTHTWRNELVIYRDDGTGNRTRPWEGPITRIEKGDGYVTIEARDVMAYVMRRIMKQGYSDAYPRNQSIVFRSARIIIDALSRGDPNVLRYLTTFQFADDAMESRVVPDYATTAWDEVDDMAAKAGLDYTTVGRRIVLFDTHRAIGKLPMMSNGDFSTDPIITEYGMNLATEYAVTNGAGIWGSATRPDDSYGVPIELLVSAYGNVAAAADVTLTPAAKTALEASLVSQAKRGISDRWPSPIIVRVPDNSTLSPDCAVTLDALVPGVWIPLRASHACGGFSQWQKLDSVTVSQDNGGEKVAVVMSPAPNQGQDPDADEVIAAGG